MLLHNKSEKTVYIKVGARHVPLMAGEQRDFEVSEYVAGILANMGVVAVGGEDQLPTDVQEGVEIEAGDESDTDTQDDMDALRAMVEEKTGKKPHHKAGRAKLEEMLADG